MNRKSDQKRHLWPKASSAIIYKAAVNDLFDGFFVFYLFLFFIASDP